MKVRQLNGDFINIKVTEEKFNTANFVIRFNIILHPFNFKKQLESSESIAFKAPILPNKIIHFIINLC